MDSFEKLKEELLQQCNASNLDEAIEILKQRLRIKNEGEVMKVNG